MTPEEQKIYMSLSNDPNERGRLWKLKKGDLKKSATRLFFEKTFVETFIRLSKESS